MQTLTKSERLCSKILIDKLFEKGKSFSHGPLKIGWLEVPENNESAQVLISVPKKIIKKAVRRNKLKRLMREAYRRNKNLLYNNLNSKKIIFMILYTSKTILDYKVVEEKMIESLDRLAKEITKEI